MKSPVHFVLLRFSRVFILATATLCLTLNVTAQGLQPRPVARLLGDSITEATLSRPRIVGVSDTRGTGATPPGIAFPDATDAERQAFDKTNAARTANGLAPLAWDSQLCRFARAHSEEMALRGYFDHDTPEGLRLKDRARAMGIQHFRVIAENIAYNKGYSEPGSFAVERWMKSPGHRSNILYEGFQASAIGSYVATDGSVYLTQVFIYR